MRRVAARYPAVDWSQWPGAQVREIYDFTERPCGLAACPGVIRRRTLLPGDFVCPTCGTIYQTDGIFIREETE